MGRGSGTVTKNYPPVLYKNIKTIRKSPKTIPDTITLEQIVASLPKEVFEKSGLKSASSLLLTIFFIACSIIFINKVPSYLYPVGWFLGGASITGLFVIGNDCNHKSFSKSPLVNSIVGTIVMLPLLYPFQSWKITERMNLSKSKSSLIRSWATGKLFWLLSISNWAENYFNLKKVEDKNDKKKALTSIVLVYVFAGIFFPLVFKFFGVSGFLNYWLAPWLIYHFLVSTFTFLPAIPFFEEEKDKRYHVHITYPKWFEFVVKDINFALPRHIAVSIPHYNLRKAYDSFQKQWSEYIYECTFELDLFRELISKSQTFSEEIFSPFDNTPLAKPKQPKQELPADRPSRSVSEFLANINWIHFILLTSTPIIALIGFFTVPLSRATFIWSVIYYHITGMGITAGYHRLFAHRAYSASLPLKVYLLFAGAGAIEGSCRWWSRDHRAHHRYTDTDKDPYSAHHGFWWSHLGWLFIKQDPKKIGKSHIEDLNEDAWVMWQHKNYVKVAFFMGILLPTLVAGLGWGDWMGGYFYAAIARLVFVHHSTFMVNSLAHFVGTSPYDDNHTPRDSIITAVLTFGEGYHNFHHEFPSDYRNAFTTFGYDPTKWMIKICEILGLAHSLKTFDQNEIQKGMVQMQLKEANKMTESIHWGVAVDQLPIMTHEEFEQFHNQGRKLIIIDDIVHDVESFVDEHPGGLMYIKMGLGKDATKMFKGDVYGHSNAARNLLSQFRIAQYKSKQQ
ncbi:delta 9 fatty acid desaturase [Heterostelium album PN500]|uniref:Delta 9 fatty acid desaturase n=1 Tax=Heterostelium pallidum (strain ATCC 26659 / Pp 5 / PN500) TaxID=670386 RepID=D3BJD9_HETP5|nr:delta 9 fatty acid desaturase [Heterostelium album PN500]EFA78019.1 delta 9 fatty acid desaturase [Heterostelium album PN500]|eukprot:XP_020430147.1 delta 9 fatty acid desaturase [Heterostelium album PN500]